MATAEEANSVREGAATLNATSFKKLFEQAFPPAHPDTFSVKGKRLRDYLESLQEVLGPFEGIATKDRLAFVGDMLNARLAFRGTDGSRIPTDRVADFYDKLRWELCSSCKRDHPVMLGMEGQRVTSQVIVCSESAIVIHVHGK